MGMDRILRPSLPMFFLTAPYYNNIIKEPKALF